MKEISKTKLNKLLDLHNSIVKSAAKTIKEAIEAGNLLNEIKNVLPHGEFTSWCETNLTFKMRTAQRYMKCYVHRDRLLKNDSVSLLTGAYKALESRTIKVDPEFRALLPPLTEAEKRGLERSILAEGCRHPIITWRGIILDGHQRYDICRKHGIEFKTIEIELEDRISAKIWILNNQLARKNLSVFERIELGLKCDQ